MTDCHPSAPETRRPGELLVGFSSMCRGHEIDTAWGPGLINIGKEEVAKGSVVRALQRLVLIALSARTPTCARTAHRREFAGRLVRHRGVHRHRQRAQRVPDKIVNGFIGGFAAIRSSSNNLPRVSWEVGGENWILDL